MKFSYENINDFVLMNEETIKYKSINKGFMKFSYQNKGFDNAAYFDAKSLMPKSNSASTDRLH